MTEMKNLLVDSTVTAEIMFQHQCLVMMMMLAAVAHHSKMHAD